MGPKVAEMKTIRNLEKQTENGSAKKNSQQIRKAKQILKIWCKFLRGGGGEGGGEIKYNSHQKDQIGIK